MNKHTIEDELRQVERLRKQYPPGTKIQCIQMDAPYHTVAPGSIGTVDHVDDVGTINMSWENESSLGLIPGEDRFKIIKKSKRNKLKGRER